MSSCSPHYPECPQTLPNVTEGGGGRGGERGVTCRYIRLSYFLYSWLSASCVKSKAPINLTGTVNMPLLFSIPTVNMFPKCLLLCLDGYLVVCLPSVMWFQILYSFPYCSVCVCVCVCVEGDPRYFNGVSKPVWSTKWLTCHGVCDTSDICKMCCVRYPQATHPMSMAPFLQYDWSTLSVGQCEMCRVA